MTTTTSPATIAFEALVDEELRKTCAELAQQINAHIEQLAVLIGPAVKTIRTIEAQGTEHFAALTSNMHPGEAADADEGWGLLWAHVSGLEVLTEAIYALQGTAHDFTGRMESTHSEVSK